MSKPHAVPEKSSDVFAVVDLAGSLYLGGLFPDHLAAKQAADIFGRPAEIVRYSVPLLSDGERCIECCHLIEEKYKEIATRDIRASHRD